MALGDSVVSICNIALTALGEDVIVSLGDNTKRAILCNRRYDDVRRFVLTGSPWNCNQKQAQLAASATPPLFQYANAFDLPADCLRVDNLPDNDRAIWDIQGNQLLTDEGAPLNVLYGCDLQDPTLLSPMVVHCIAYALAVELAIPLTQKESKKAQLLKLFVEKQDAARLTDSQQNSVKEWDEDILLRARR